MDIARRARRTCCISNARAPDARQRLSRWLLPPLSICTCSHVVCRASSRCLMCLYRYIYACILRPPQITRTSIATRHSLTYFSRCIRIDTFSSLRSIASLTAILQCVSLSRVYQSFHLSISFFNLPRLIKKK